MLLLLLVVRLLLLLFWRSRDLWVLKAYSTSSSSLLLLAFFLTLLMVGFWGCFSWSGGEETEKTAVWRQMGMD